jgi:hypothetical protein
MYGGLLKTASAAAILAAAGFFGAGSATAADLGGDCCADLEERVAELEATTVRKGNRKVSLTLSGYVSHHVMYWNDGTQSDTYIGDGGNYGSRFRFVGSAKISPTLTAGFLYEFQANSNAIGSMNQLNGGDDLGNTGATTSTTGCGFAGSSAGCIVMRDSTVWMRHSQLGMIKVGHGSTTNDNLVLIDLGGMSGASTPDVALYNGGFILRGTNGNLGTTAQNWTAALRGHESWDNNRRNHILYETPTLAGFTVQAAVAEDNYWDVALRYAGEFGGFRLAFGIGYQEDSDFNRGLQIGAPSGPGPAILCVSNCDLKSSEIKGSASILHVPTGLFVTGAGGNRELEGAGAGALGVPDLTFWYVAGGISQNFFGFGKTVLFGEYSEHKGALAQTAFVAENAALHPFNVDSEATVWGLGAVQYIDAAAMEVFLTYKNYSLSTPAFIPIDDFQAVIGGARVSF